MTYKQWEKQLKKHLSSLSASERTDALEYYRELYGDKREAGETDEEIVSGFGAPEVCAKRILAETDENNASYADSADYKGYANYAPKRKKRKFGNYSPAQIAGIVCLTVLILCPLAEIALAVVASFAAVSLAGGIVAVAGAVYVPLSLSFGVGFGATVAHVGSGIAACGVGLVLLAAFFLAAKYTVIGCVKGVKFLYKLG